MGFFSVSLLVSPGTVQAARLSEDPLVIIDADVTSQYGPCTEVFHANIGTKEETTTRFSCPAGTLLKSEIVRRSQAVARHEPYVLAPAPNASAAEKQRIRRAFRQFIPIKPFWDTGIIKAIKYRGAIARFHISIRIISEIVWPRLKSRSSSGFRSAIPVLGGRVAASLIPIPTIPIPIPS